MKTYSLNNSKIVPGSGVEGVTDYGYACKSWKLVHDDSWPISLTVVLNHGDCHDITLNLLSQTLKEVGGFDDRFQISEDTHRIRRVLVKSETLKLTGDLDAQGKIVFDRFIAEIDPAPFSMKRGTIADFKKLMQGIADCAAAEFATIAAFADQEPRIDRVLPPEFEIVAYDILKWYRPTGGYIRESPDHSGPAGSMFYPIPALNSGTTFCDDLVAFYKRAGADLGLDQDAIHGRMISKTCSMAD